MENIIINCNRKENKKMMEIIIKKMSSLSFHN